MPYIFAFYPDPLDSQWTLRSDNGFVGHGTSYTDPATGRKGQVIVVPDTVPDSWGAELLGNKAGYQESRTRGFLVLKDGVARIQPDDFKLIPIPQPGPDPIPFPSDPHAIVMYVYNSTNPNLKTKVGCGQFCEDVVEALHNSNSTEWGHVRKSGAQNQYNGHAVDSGMLRSQSGATGPGTYDFIEDSESDNATPTFFFKDVAHPELWYYPPAPVVTVNA